MVLDKVVTGLRESEIQPLSILIEFNRKWNNKLQDKVYTHRLIDKDYAIEERAELDRLYKCNKKHSYPHWRYRNKK